MATVVLDHFTGTNGAALNSRTPDATDTPGGTWSDPSSGWSIQSNRLQFTGSGLCVAHIESGVANHIVTCTVNFASGQAAGLVARWGDDNNFLLGLLLNDGTGHGQLFIFKRVGGGFTTLSSSGTFAAAANTDFTLKLSVDGSNLITLDWQSGTQVITATDSAGSSNTKVGLYSNNYTNSIWDDFKVDSAATGTITITSPAQYQTFQRNGSNQASIPISGTYTGSPTAIEASFNGGSYATIASSPTGGTYSGTLTAQVMGDGTLTVRFTNDTSTNATKMHIRIGDVFLIIGDSIAEGRGTNGQTYTAFSGNGVSAFRQDNAWVDGNDPVDTGTSSGSHWPLLGSLLVRDLGCPVAFITTATGGTDVAGATNTWAKNNTEYANAITSVGASGVNGVKAVLAHLGPNAIYNGNGAAIARSTYASAIATLGDNLNADVVGGPSLFVGLCGESQNAVPPDLRTAEDNIRLAIQSVWGTHNVMRGPVLIDQKYENGSGGEGASADKVHPKSNTHLQQVADRWWAALKDGLYGGTAGRGPQVTGTPTLDPTRKIITVTYNQSLGTNGSNLGGYRVTDLGTVVGVSSAVAAGGTRVLLQMSAALSTAGNTLVNFGSDDDAIGQTVPGTSNITTPDGRTIQLPAEPFLNQSVAAENTAKRIRYRIGMR